MFHLVLVEPEIPSNTGNISRTCAITNSSLHLVKPLGFSTDDKYLKRAGLDYWQLLDLHYHNNLEEVFENYPQSRFFFCTTKTRKKHTENCYQPGDFFVFGKETKGLPESLLAQYPEKCIRIPMISETRSLNLSNSAAIVLYEALRQVDFPGMK